MSSKFISAYLLTLVNVLGFSILIPVLPFVVEYYNAPTWVYGALLSSYSFFQFLAAPWLGKLSDRVGRKSILMVSQAGTLLSWIIFGAAYFLPKDSTFLGISLALVIIAISRIFDGITGGNTAVAEAYVSDITTPTEKNTIFSTLGGIAGLGMILGPGLGGWLASGSLHYLGTIIFAAIISIITLIAIQLFLKESLPPEKRRKDNQEPWWLALNLIKRIQMMNPPKMVKGTFLLRGLFTVLMSSYVSTIVLYVIDLFHFTQKELGLFMVLVGCFLSFNQLFVVKHFLKKWGAVQTLQRGLLLVGIGVIGITLTQTLWIYALIYYVMNLGIAMCMPCFNTLLSQHSRPQELGETMGVSNSIVSLVSAFMPLVAASIYAKIHIVFYWCLSIIPFSCWVLTKKWLLLEPSEN